MKAGWEVKPLGEVCDYSRGLTYKKADEVEFSTKRVLRANNIDRETSALDYSEIRYLREEFEIPNAKKIAHGSILICTASGSKSHLGKVALVDTDEDFAFGGFMGLITPKDGLLPQFLHYAMTSKSYLDFIDRNTDGANINNLKFSQLAEFSFPIPPLEEQKRIVAVLDAAFEGLTRAEENAKANLQNARGLFDGFTQSKMDGSQLDTKRVKLSEVCSIVSKLVDPKEDQYQDLLHLGAGNMVTESDVLVEVKTAKEEGLISGKHPFTEHDVLYSKIRPYLKKVARPSFAGLCSADVYPLTPCANLDRNYLFQLLMSPEFTAYAIAGSGRAGMPKVNRKHMFDFEFDLPSVIEQVQIAQEIDQLRLGTTELDSSYCAKLTDIADLRQSLLQKAFAGELT